MKKKTKCSVDAFFTTSSLSVLLETSLRGGVSGWARPVNSTGRGPMAYNCFVLELKRQLCAGFESALDFTIMFKPGVEESTKKREERLQRKAE
jgi:hypothetical protein